MTNKNHSKLRVGGQLLIISAFTLLMAMVSWQAKADTVHTQVEKEWTFLLFLNGHNNLDSFGAMNINQMEEVGSTDKVNLVVQWASLENGDTQRILVTKDTNKNRVTSPAVEILSPVDMGDYRELVKFIDWGAKNYPAKKYFVAVWNHGSGWHRLKNGNAQLRDISNDDISGGRITTEELGLAMKDAANIVGRKIDLYGSDACLMAMAEVAGEMADSVSFFAGSQDLEPGEGWPYSTFVKRWVAKPTMDGAELGKILTEEYVKSYNGGIYGNKEVTFSAYDLSKYSIFTNSLKNLSSMISNLSVADTASLKKSVENTQAFYFDDYKDVSDFLKQAQGQNINVSAAVFADVKDSVSKFVIANGATGSFAAKSQGLSIWMPTSDYDMANYETRYEKLMFNQDSNWLSVLRKINK